jgi:RNA polymerase sigma-70 factor (ECF subfamily)
VLFFGAPWSGLRERYWFSAPFVSFDLQHLHQHHGKVLPIVTKYPDVAYDSVGSTSSSLLDRVKARDEAAWQRLVSVYGHLVLYWCRCAGIRREDRVDVCQEVFRAVAANIDSFRHDQPGGTFRGWLRTITRSKVADHFRRQDRQPGAVGGSAARERFLAIPDSDASSAAEAGNPEKAILVNRALDLIRNEFEDRTWQAFWRATVECQPSDVVAESLEMTPAAVRQAKSRVLRRLREELHQLLEQEEQPLE